MSPVHLHLLLNHLPILGSFLAVPLTLLALWRRDLGAVQATLLLTVLAGGGAVVVKETGEESEEAVEDLPGVSEAMIEDHAELADTATILAVLTGLGALALGVQTLRKGAPTQAPALAGLLLGQTLTAGAMAWTGYAGGQIRHTEIRDGVSLTVSENEADERGEANERGEAGER